VSFPPSCDIPGNYGAPFPLGAKDEFRDFPHGAASAIGLCYVYGFGLYLGRRVGDRDRKRGAPHHRYVHEVVADVANVFVFKPVFLEQVLVWRDFFRKALKAVFNTELHGPSFDCFGFSARQECNAQARALEIFYAASVARVEAFHFPPVVANYNAPVGKDAVDVEHDQFDIFAGIVNVHWIYFS
jgi:hypothetical protein